MVFKKPYAFLIKYFKVIHLVLTFFSIYLIMRVNSILGFFNSFIRNSVTKLESVNYINNFYIVIIILSVIMCLIILVLMRYKKKPHLLYIVLIAVYLAIGFVIGYANGGLDRIYNHSVSMKDLLLYRDVLKILLVFQYISFGFIFIRALGFDIKKFNFDADLEGFEVAEDDDEEIELTLKEEDTSKYERKVRRKLRELRYYYVENKLYINVILGIVLFTFLSGIFVNKEILNKVYSENEYFSTDYFTFSVTGSYISNISYDNKKVTDTDSSFVIVRLSVRNNNVAKELNDGKILLYTKENSYSSKLRYGEKFKDLGSIYTGNKIQGSKSYIFIFNVNNKELNGELLFTYGNDKKVRLKPIDIDKVSDSVIYKLSENIDFSSTFFGNGSFKINSYEFGERFDYSYTYEVMGQPYEGKITIKSINKTILHLVIESTCPNGYDNYTFLSTYGSLKYSIGGVEYSSRFDNKTPGSYNDGVYLTVDKELEHADSIWFDIIIRNKHYIYYIK